MRDLSATPAFFTELNACRISDLRSSSEVAPDSEAVKDDGPAWAVPDPEYT